MYPSSILLRGKACSGDVPISMMARCSSRRQSMARKPMCEDDAIGLEK
jgi:hypothetical protein